MAAAGKQGSRRLLKNCFRRVQPNSVGLSRHIAMSSAAANVTHAKYGSSIAAANGRMPQKATIVAAIAHHRIAMSMTDPRPRC